jgi:Na+/proline symporter/nitrogen-specific signal transduction histidine kinase
VKLGLPWLAFAGLLWLFGLFWVAFAVEQGAFKRIARHPLTAALGLGVYATSWSFYGSVGFARSQGYLFLTIYLGFTLACLLVPVLWTPVLRLAREHQLTSLADLFAFRYRSPLVGPLVTVFMLAGSLPYLALQVRALAESTVALTGASSRWLGLALCGTLTVFTILFGARHLSPRDRHEGMAVAIAFESVLKLVALLLVGGFVVAAVWGGPQQLSAWTRAHGEVTSRLWLPVRDGPWGTLLLLSFSAAFLLPRQFHMAFAESADERSLTWASWAVPLYLLLMNLVIPPILWAGDLRLPGGDPDFFVLSVPQLFGSRTMSLLAWLGGLSASSAMLVVTALALSSMCLNHLVLPLRKRAPDRDLYKELLGARRILIALIILSGFGFYLLLQTRRGLAELGLVSFVATAQFLPGLAGVLFWRRASRQGFVIGLSAGAAIWAALLLFPLLLREEIFPTPLELAGLFGVTRLDPWGFTTFLSLGVNGLLFAAVSLFTSPRPEDVEAARACARNAFSLPIGALTAASPAEFEGLLVPILGTEAARSEVQRALADLSMEPVEKRPDELLRLRAQIEKNLSGLMGPSLARVVVGEGLRMDPRARTALADHLRSLERQLLAARVPLQGAAAELEAARRYFRRVLEDLPLGVVALGPDGEVTIWNAAMARLSNVEGPSVVGLSLERLPAPWGSALAAYAESPSHPQLALDPQTDPEGTRTEVWLEFAAGSGSTAGRRCFVLRRSQVDEAALPPHQGGPPHPLAGLVLQVAEVTGQKSLQAQLAHQDRLASIGRLAAGVAHEVGNPLTGIASIAQNLRDDREPEAVGERAALILEQTRRIDGIVRSLVRFSHAGLSPGQSAEPGLPSSLDLREVVEDALRLVRLSRRARGVEVDDQCPPGLPLLGDRQQLVQVLVNLVTNACDASAAGKQVVVRGSREGAARVLLEVVDSGSGIPEELRPRIFEPFVTTKAPGEGTGLGLSLVYSIVREHGGTVEVESAVGEGTRVSVRLPALAGAQPARALPG